MPVFKMQFYNTSTGGHQLQTYNGRKGAPGYPDVQYGESFTEATVKITPKALAVLEKAEQGSGHVAFTWVSNQLGEAYTPWINDGTFQNLGVRYTGGPDSDKLVLGTVTIPGAVPQTNLGDGNQPAEPGIDAPLLRSFGGAFFDLAVSPGNSISLNYTASASVQVNLANVRQQFANSFGNLLRGFFGPLPVPELTPPEPNNPSSALTLYHVDDVFNAPPSGDNEVIPPGLPPTPPGGGADERFLPLINSNLTRMSGQLGRMLELMKGLKDHKTTIDINDTWFKWFNLLKDGVSLAERLLGVSGKTAELGADLATALTSVGNLNNAIDKYKDVIDRLTDGGADDMLDSRFDTMADLFQYNGRSITQYLADILAELKKPGSSSTGGGGLTVDNFNLYAELMDRYFVAPGSSEFALPGNVTESAGPIINLPGRVSFEGL